MITSVFSPPTALQSVEVQLVRLPNAVGLARKLVREWFLYWGLPERVREDAELIASELVTNAVTKAEGETIWLRLRWWQVTGYVEVWDADPTPPIQRQAEDTAPAVARMVSAPGTRG